MIDVVGFAYVGRVVVVVGLLVDVVDGFLDGIAVDIHLDVVDYRL